MWNQLPENHWWFLELGFEQSLAVVLSMLILNIILHTRIKFGSMVVTHMTTTPYKIAYIFLIMALL